MRQGSEQKYFILHIIQVQKKIDKNLFALKYAKNAFYLSELSM